MRNLCTITCWCFLTFLVAPIAQADITTVYTSNTGGVYDYSVSYSSIGGILQLQAGNFFTIYDFRGYIPGSETTLANWSFSSANLGVTPVSITPPNGDDPAIPNLTWTYTGPTITTDQAIGTFSAQSYFTTLGISSVAEQDYNANLFTTNQTATSILAPLPEPSERLLILGGLVMSWTSICWRRGYVLGR
jgi:hypothetical protein